EFGPRVHQLVVDRHDIGDAGEPAFGSLAQAHQADDVGAVGVIVERDLADLVAAQRGIVEPLALVGDVAHHMAEMVLRPGIAQMDADAPIEHGQVVVGIFRRVQRADAHETARPVDQVAFDGFELAPQRIKGKLRQADVEQVVGMRFRDGERVVELARIRRRQFDGPGALVGDVVMAPGDMGFEGTGLHQGPLGLSVCGDGANTWPRSNTPSPCSANSGWKSLSDASKPTFRTTRVNSTSMWFASFSAQFKVQLSTQYTPSLPGVDLLMPAITAFDARCLKRQPLLQNV